MTKWLNDYEKQNFTIIIVPEQLIRYSSILLDIADGTRRELTSSRVCSRSAESMQAPLCTRSTADFDELIHEKRGTTWWLHFAVGPSGNRRKILFDMRWQKKAGLEARFSLCERESIIINYKLYLYNSLPESSWPLFVWGSLFS